ncbi:helix-turn-helix transcriptional regulator [Bacillus sp. JJ1127]|uniref:helix-turn-helix domain-containing protein n=1 Tax=Bacillus sp. JJ1127 TaxID=3122952 RepID=UPI002FFDD651
MDIGAQLKFLRNRRGWTIQETAEKVELSVSTYGGYETNYRKPNAEVLCQLADVFNSTTDFILGRTDNPNGDDFDLEKMLTEGKLNWAGEPLNKEQLESILPVFRLALQRDKK